MKQMEVTYLILPAIILMCPLNGCIEPFSAEIVDFESALVIDATITDRMSIQEIGLSRTYRLESDGSENETDAQVWVTSSDGTRYDFTEADNGLYRSTLEFSAVPNTDYTLSVVTRDGRSYSSTASRLTSSTAIDSLYAERMVTDLGEEGMAVMVNSFDESNSSKYYRYEYEETYKIVAPEFAPKDLVFEPGLGWIFPARPIEQEVCFTTDLSNRIVLGNTEDLDEDRLERFVVRFINRDNYIISHRYSVLVRQYVQSIEAHNFYTNLNSFSSQESLFSETQPGFLEGNVFSLEDSSEKVLGYFDVSAVDEKRIYFNYEDFFPGEELPPYAEPCIPDAPDGDDLFSLVEANFIKFITENYPGSGTTGTGPYITVPRICGDCTVLGSPEPPEFWIE